MSALQQRNGQRQQKNFNNNFNNNRFNNMNKKNFNRFPNNKGTGQIGHVQTQTNGIKPNRDAVIRRNIQHMQQVAQKKRVAQERYYGDGRSPMIKTTSGPFIKQENQHSNRARVSVQQRLGNRSRQIPIVQNKKFINRPNNGNQFINNTGMRSDKIIRIQNMQQKKTRFRNPNAGIKTINSAGKVVFLQPVRRPANYTVRVDNNVRKHHVNQGLNPVLQQEIKLIQSKSSRQIVAPVAPVVQPQPVTNLSNSYEVDRLPIVATTRTLHERFSMI